MDTYSYGGGASVKSIIGDDNLISIDGNVIDDIVHVMVGGFGDADSGGGSVPPPPPPPPPPDDPKPFPGHGAGSGYIVEED